MGDDLAGVLSRVEALDRDGLLVEITKTLSDQRVKVQSLKSSVSDEHIATIQISFTVSDTKQLGSLIARLRNAEGVFDVYRIMG